MLYLKIFIKLHYKISHDLVIKLHMILFVIVQNNILLSLSITLFYHFIFIKFIS